MEKLTNTFNFRIVNDTTKIEKIVYHNHTLDQRFLASLARRADAFLGLGQPSLVLEPLIQGT